MRVSVMECHVETGFVTRHPQIRQPVSLMECFVVMRLGNVGEKNGFCAVQQADRLEPNRISASVYLLYTESEHSSREKESMEINNFVAKLLVAFWLAMLKMDSLSDFNSWHSSISAELQRGEEQYGTLEEQPAHARNCSRLLISIH